MKNNIFINRYVMACAIAIVITLVGLICMNTLPIEQYPNIAPPTVRVSTSYTGADANTIMKAVVQPLEENINGVPGMTYITSSASASGDVSIQVFFEQGTDPDLAAVNVQNRVSRATALLPSEVTKVGVQVMKQQSNILHIGALKSVDGKYDTDFIANYIDINIKPRLMRITGVGDVISLGNTYALRIWLKPDVMAQYGLEPNDVFAAIGGQSFVAATGSLGEQSENAYQYSMEYKGTLKTVEEFNEIVLRTSEGGHLLHLSDVAEVEIGAVSYNFTSNIDGQPGTIYMVFQAPGANATEVNARINKLYEELKPTMPAGLEFEIHKQQVVLKYLLSTSDVKYRPPYGTAYSSHRRYASFIGTTNEMMPLTDPTGSRRFICVMVDGNIDFETPVEYGQLYAQLKYEVEQQRERYFLTKNEEAALMHHNLRYQQMNGLSEMLLSLFEKPDGTPKDNPENGQWLSVKEISDRLKQAFKGAYQPDEGSLVKIGQCLNRPEYRFESERKTHGWVYWVKER